MILDNSKSISENFESDETELDSSRVNSLPESYMEPVTDSFVGSSTSVDVERYINPEKTQYPIILGNYPPSYTVDRNFVAYAPEISLTLVKAVSSNSEAIVELDYETFSQISDELWDLDTRFGGSLDKTMLKFIFDYYADLKYGRSERAFRYGSQGRTFEEYRSLYANVHDVGIIDIDGLNIELIMTIEGGVSKKYNVKVRTVQFKMNVMEELYSHIEMVVCVSFMEPMSISIAI